MPVSPDIAPEPTMLDGILARLDLAAQHHETAASMLTGVAADARRLLDTLADDDTTLRPRLNRADAAARATASTDRGTAVWLREIATAIRNVAPDTVADSMSVRLMLAAYGTCPKCERWTFIGHGPLCGPCYVTAVQTQAADHADASEASERAVWEARAARQGPEDAVAQARDFHARLAPVVAEAKEEIAERRGFATGGVIPPRPADQDDRVPVLLAPGCAYVSPKAAERYRPILDRINATRPPSQAQAAAGGLAGLLAHFGVGRSKITVGDRVVWQEPEGSDQ